MFGQVVGGHTEDPIRVRRALEHWVQESPPEAPGWVAVTAGVTHDGTFIAVLLFDSEQAARDNTDRRGQDRWWAEVCAALDGEVTVSNGVRTRVVLTGEVGRAGFVQVVQGRVSDHDVVRERIHELQEALEAHLPALLGSVTIELAAGRFTRTLSFTTEEEARAGEREMPPQLQARDQDARQFLVGPLDFLDLREPWSYASR